MCCCMFVVPMAFIHVLAAVLFMWMCYQAGNFSGMKYGLNLFLNIDFSVDIMDSYNNQVPSFDGFV